ncbi:DUF551 domain-containing protein [Klebsiella variicola subsp. variicola]|uniref:DUF551 domain-containing protein n=1 Tax=Klebsiella variicola TaxID=244366 RepID=UPI00292B2D84|nr:DUF551 domain-containing protein [Klebsiella variicola]MDV0623934.1 DUF551 domain-containing protein [Klebsiella variicola subsp. variicola]
MTNNQLTPESVTRFTQYGVDMMEWPDGAYVKYEDYAALVEELQERRRAEMDSEQIVFTDERNLHHIAMGRETSLIWGKQNHEAGDIPLFRHPQPTVSEPVMYCMEGNGLDPEAVSTSREVVEAWVNEWNSEGEPIYSTVPLYRHAQPAPVVPVKIPGSVYQVIYQECGGFVDCDANAQTIWNACRAAMLQAGNSPAHSGPRPEQISGSPAQDGNSPVFPGIWIPVSERMPEKNQSVLISVNFDSSLVEPLICTARYTGSTFRRGAATVKPGAGIEEATHWMPLPVAPQKAE